MPKQFGLRLSIPFIEEYLFKNKVHISHVEMDHGSGTVVIFFRNAGCETREGCMISEIREDTLPKAMEYIKECLTQD